MRRLPSLIGFLLSCILMQAQSPHGERLKINCAQCHSPVGWEMDREYATFSHDSTGFALTGRHADLDCKSCHGSLKFHEAQTDCFSCHTDPHQQTVGVDCKRCHTTQSWIVDEISMLHVQNGFPLLGNHAKADCRSCHQSESELRFERIGNECVNCHLGDYESTTQPAHKSSGYSQDCASCHDPASDRWRATNIDHDFFPLTGVHDVGDCKQCHKTPDYSNTSADCFACHQADFENSRDPNHLAAGFSTKCTDCHQLTPDWMPANFDRHDGDYFPIYSGEHKGEWKSCASCHLNPSNYKEFSCVVCHTNPDVGEEHKKVRGYVFNDQACLACHPNGDKLTIFDHDATAFPLTGAHEPLECLLCHASGFKGTSSACVDCHTTDYDQSVNPSHKSLGLSKDCAQCHTTAPDWNPARFDDHDRYYTLNGAHKQIANSCGNCHNGDYNNTPNTCAGCHIEDYNQTLSPPHKTLQFSTDCAGCHGENVWVPSTFDHDGKYFPINSGKHKGEWMECRDCHTNPGSYKEFSCTVCHLNPDTDQEHTGVPGYWYQDQACLACHPTGNASDRFDHNSTGFPLTGAHQQVDCKSCHVAGFENTPTDCQACHLADFQGSLNPDHEKLGFNMDCAQCHTTVPGWQPAKLDQHDSYYKISGAHIGLDCSSCHKGDYNNTPNTCAGCHIEDYNKTIDPPHQTLQFSTDCATCHSENAWVPSTFDHDGMFFPIYSGKHKGEWMECRDCHTNPNNIKEFSCTNCHTNPETDDKHKGVSGYFYNNNACLACHPSGSKEDVFDHNTTAFPLTGAHQQVNCFECHSSGFKGTPTNCSACHRVDFEGSMNPSHVNLGFSMDCATCHTTAPDWQPARLDQHDQYYPLNGAHKQIASNCAACHNGNYNNTPNTCAGCHIDDYNQTKDPDHLQAQFSTDCATCHSENTWVPSTFDHDGQYFPIYSGEHKGEWMECRDCHNNPSNFKEFTCINCHINPETDEKHIGVNGYFYNNQACLGCHPTGSGDDKFDHNNTAFPLTGAHLQVDCKSCHTTGFKGTPMECEKCHEPDFNGSTNPNHVSLGFPMNCIACHTTAPDWKPALLPDHDRFYPLTGKHLEIANDCAACHRGDYNNTPNTCAGCHQEDYNSSTNPNHNALGLPTDCALCHTTNAGWEPALMPDHDQYYPLTGAHLTIAADCAACHHGDYNNTPNTCQGCHLEDFNNSRNPNHVVLNFPQECATCHTTNPGWEPASMPTHDQYYPLTGAHMNIASDCAACHHGDYNNTPNTCEGCHRSDYNGSSNPSHTRLGLPLDCALCHTTNPDWQPAGFPDHDSYYPLNGAHQLIASDCARCHNGNYNNTPNTCVGCHLDDYNQTSNPDHEAQQYPRECIDCHTETAWIPSTFDHNNYYPLTGGHDLIRDDCFACHRGSYGNTPNTCKGCHTQDFNQTTNPNHVSLGFSMECATCHTTNPGWEPATLPDHDRFYPLLGAHRNIQNDCAACHHGNYNNTPNTCVGCHLDDYNQTNNPDHQTAQFPTNCESCHSQNAWVPSTFNHDGQYFPIYSGKHRNEWTTCSECHTNPNNYNIFSCIDCHEHNNRRDMDDKHRGVTGYSYNSNACYQCHPDGRK